MGEFTIVDEGGLSEAIKALAAAVDSMRIVADLLRKVAMDPPELTPNITVNVPELASPDITLAAPAPTYEMPPVNIQIPEDKPKKLHVIRNSDGYITDIVPS